MLKIYSTIHYLVIISALLLGIGSAHACIDVDIDNKSETSYISSSSNHDLPVDIALDCNQASCHHGCNHLFDTNNSTISKLSNIDARIFNNLEGNSLFSEYTPSLSKPPKA